MKKVEVIVDRSKCISLGVCEATSTVFELDENSDLIIHEDRIPGSDLDEVREAVLSCPVKALSMTVVEDPEDEQSGRGEGA